MNSPSYLLFNLSEIRTIQSFLLANQHIFTDRKYFLLFPTKVNKKHIKLVTSYIDLSKALQILVNNMLVTTPNDLQDGKKAFWKDFLFFFCCSFRTVPKQSEFHTIMNNLGQCCKRPLVVPGC